MNNSNLPKNWKSLSLVKDLGYVKTGVEYYEGEKKYYSTGSVKNASLVAEGKFEYNKRPTRANRVGMLGDVFQARMKKTNKATIINNELDGDLFSTGFIQIRPNKEILISEYIYYYFLSLNFNEIKDKLCSGSTQEALNDQNAKKIMVPIPPIEEQNMIVQKISEIFSQVDRTSEILQKTYKQIEIYRQSILKSAFEGKFTEFCRKENNPDIDYELSIINDEREQKAKEYGKKVKKINPIDGSEINELPQIPKEWKWIRAGSLYYYVTSGSRGWAKYYSQDGAIFVRITNLNYNSLSLNLERDKIQYVSLPGEIEGKRTRIDQGDFLFSITGYLGMFAIAPDLKEAYVNQHVALCKPVSRVNRKFFGYWVMSKTGGNYYINKFNKGATKAGLTLDDIQNFYIPFCNLDEQNAIVEEIEKRLSQCDNIEKIINESLKKAEALKQSVLNKAFRGELLD